MFIRVSLTPTASRRASEVHSLFLLFSWRVLRRSRFPHPRPRDARSGLAAEAAAAAVRIARQSAPVADCRIGSRLRNFRPASWVDSSLKMRHVPTNVTSATRAEWRAVLLNVWFYRTSDVSVTVIGLCIFSLPMLHVNVDGVRSGVGRCISRSRSLWAIDRANAAAATPDAKVCVWCEWRLRIVYSQCSPAARLRRRRSTTNTP